MEEQPVIEKAVLIDSHRIELYWNMQVRGADEERYFQVRKDGKTLQLHHWREGDEWNSGTVYQKEHQRTTICLEEPVLYTVPQNRRRYSD